MEETKYIVAYIILSVSVKNVLVCTPPCGRKSCQNVWGQPVVTRSFADDNLKGSVPLDHCKIGILCLSGLMSYLDSIRIHRHYMGFKYSECVAVRVHLFSEMLV